MIVAVALCPGAPLLVPGLAPALAAAVPELVGSCRTAVTSLRGAERILLVTSGPRSRDQGTGRQSSTVQHRSGTLVSSAMLTDSRLATPFSSRLALPGGVPAVQGVPGTGTVDVGVGVLVGVALLDDAGVTSPATAIELGGGAGFADGTDFDLLRAAVGGPAERVGLLVIGEGTGSRGPDSPGGGHDDARTFDASLAAALNAADPPALQEAVEAGLGRASEMVWTSGPSLGALARLCTSRPPSTGRLLYDDAPFGVGYLVATWGWRPAQDPAASDDAPSSGMTQPTAVRT